MSESPRTPPELTDERIYRIWDDQEFLFDEDEFDRALKFARAILAAQAPVIGEVTITTDRTGNCVAVTRTDDEHRILKVIWERKPTVAQAPAEPVAWRYRYHSGGEWKLANESCDQWQQDHPRFEQEPLYTHPKP